MTPDKSRKKLTKNKLDASSKKKKKKEERKKEKKNYILNKRPPPKTDFLHVSQKSS